MPSISSDFVQLCVEYSAIALLYYDYALTFLLEVKYLWGKRMRLTTLLYICCRYALVANITYLLTLYGIIEHGCNTGYLISAALGILGRIAVLISWGMRTYVVYNRSKLVLLLLSTLAITCIILNIVSAIGSQCQWRYNIPFVGRFLSVVMGVFEVLTTILTTFRGIQALHVSGPWWQQPDNLYSVMVEQGLVYFFSVSGFSFAAMVLNFKAPAIQRLLNAYAMPFAGLMTARFILHLRKWEEKRALAESDSGKTPGIGSLRFRPDSRNTSFLDEFGEDPVLRATRETASGHNLTEV